MISASERATRTTATIRLRSACAERVDEYAAPQWTSSDHPQQSHLDFYLADLEDGERQVLEWGATKAEHQPGTSFRVFLDPAGHPFCLCQG